MIENKLKEQIERYQPINEQEAVDQQVMLAYMNSTKDVLTRENKIAHFSASGWVVNKSREKVLMIYHNIYQSWAWTGGHADGESDLLQVARREAQEETGITKIKTMSDKIASLEILTVNGHQKRGVYVPSHLHLNVTYLLEADDSETLMIKEDENSAVRWIPKGEVIAACSEPWMRPIYQKLLNRTEREFA